jgi:hypothetical protein
MEELEWRKFVTNLEFAIARGGRDLKDFYKTIRHLLITERISAQPNQTKINNLLAYAKRIKEQSDKCIAVEVQKDGEDYFHPENIYESISDQFKQASKVESQIGIETRVKQPVTKFFSDAVSAENIQILLQEQKVIMLLLG